MANRVKDMELTQIVANNLQRICKEHDLSSRELSMRADMPQKTVWNMLNGEHSCRLTNLEKLAKTLLVSEYGASHALSTHQYTYESPGAEAGGEVRQALYGGP